MAEARILASLDHPNIVPVHDMGRTDSGSCFVVSKFIEGSDLSRKSKKAPPSLTEPAELAATVAEALHYAHSAELVATVAEALHYAHRKGLVHRDIKPANLLRDTTGKPYVADFGLALKEEDFGKEANFAGTPAYMSPEQARGEGHRVDGRSDIFSLGVVFYELLTGRRPFRGETREELLDQIVSVEARPPRQLDDTIPKELERICLKALAKRASERYTTAKDLADDLIHFLNHRPAADENLISAIPPTSAPLPTPARLLNGLRKRCPALPAHLGLKEALAALRRGQDIPAGKKVLIVLDQFEQWLHAKPEEQNKELVQALRHCDGGRVQNYRRLVRGF